MCNHHHTEAISPNVDNGITIKNIVISDTFTKPDEFLLNSSQSANDNKSTQMEMVTSENEPFSKRNIWYGYLRSTHSATNIVSTEIITSSFENINTGHTNLDPDRTSTHSTISSTESIVTSSTAVGK